MGPREDERRRTKTLETDIFWAVVEFVFFSGCAKPIVEFVKRQVKICSVYFLFVTQPTPALPIL